MSFSLTVSSTIHDQMLQRLMRAPIDRFWDRTPVGRIMNRLSVDVREIDFGMYLKLSGTLSQVLSFFVPMGYIHAMMPFYFSLCCIPFYYLAFTIVKCYWNTVVPLRYLTQVSRSEVNTHVAEAEHGRASARAFGVTEPIAYSQRVAVDHMLSADFATSSIRRWVINRLLVLYSFFCTVVAVLGVFSEGVISVGCISLCLTNSIFVIMQIESYLDQTTAAQFGFIAMNRLHEFTELVQEREEELDTDMKYSNVVITVPRSTLNTLESEHNDQGIQIARTSIGSGKCCQPCRFCVSRSHRESDKVSHEAILSQVPNSPAFMAVAGETLALLDPGNKEFAALDPWHRLVAVNGVANDAAKMAEELCHGHSDSVTVRILSGWLAQGASLNIRNLVAGYGKMPIDVLKGVDVTIERKTKVALAGTTGCGKSTLILCILRVLEPRAGTIMIEGVNTQDLGLYALRKSLGLVPQDPVIFTGTIRANLDPFQEYTDEQMWRALANVQLISHVKKLGAGLESGVKAAGENLSFGQRQLLCIARMILRQPALLLLDEATSAIDPRTQEVVQQAIRSCFPDSTLVAVAHRLETVLDFDRVIVMEQGHVVEHGSVKELANTKGGLFAKMLNASKHLSTH